MKRRGLSQDRKLRLEHRQGRDCLLQGGLPDLRHRSIRQADRSSSLSIASTRMTAPSSRARSARALNGERELRATSTGPLRTDGSIRQIRVPRPPRPKYETGEEEILSVHSPTSRQPQRAEEALSKAQTELAHATRVTTLGEMSASIAHEVNQPLTAIMVNGDAGLRWLNRAIPDLAEVREALEANGRARPIAPAR